MGLRTDIPVVACACRATPERGVEILFHAFDRYKNESHSNAVMVYAGTGAQFEELSKLRDTLASAAAIRMLGYVREPPSLLRTANVCAVPSFHESFSLTALGMMVRGRAVVATRVGGVVEAMEDGVLVLLIPAKDIGSLAVALARVLWSPNLRKTLRAAARERASRLFTSDEQISEMLDTFHEVFAGDAGRASTATA